MLTSTSLALALLLATGSAVADRPDAQRTRGCAYNAEARMLKEVHYGVFEADRPPFADENGVSIQVDGRWVHPDKAGYPVAKPRAWFNDSTAISFQGQRYNKDGLPMVYGVDEVKLTGELDGVPVAVGGPMLWLPPGAILVLVDPLSCGFQRYLPV